MNKHILEKIYNTYYSDIKENKEVTSLIERLQTKLKNKLNEEENELFLFKRFIEACNEEVGCLSYESFKQGFRASVMLMVEAFNY